MNCGNCGKPIKRDDYREYTHIESGLYTCHPQQKISTVAESPEGFRNNVSTNPRTVKENGIVSTGPQDRKKDRPMPVELRTRIRTRQHGTESSSPSRPMRGKSAQTSLKEKLARSSTYGKTQ